MNKWEYSIATGVRGHSGENYSFSGKDFSNPQQLLDYAGENGWELAGVASIGRTNYAIGNALDYHVDFYFKRLHQ